ncbi:bifunctional 4-hydroxy-2-oxoglutarate aldolase/2-dehydro-3-deoxy-phosphogluconate aldolase [Marivirga lumbricoides]|uniref:Bifunctional 4-hydroxy-2-oxoglutarate aldolase/2-dehydro-3-deoxy-phosphogluconate aldolase n=1 Tax=Marivirga lumbricoides TaxID=1046115 RepID=A0A2T4DT91_9BACT|nr:bifunctional 4-hydroxy-2-oxoglutarate aldolase/2-dehydro-3-deoxy-phosphogluconate aldolase [Marivirga lumbricoides]
MANYSRIEIALKMKEVGVIPVFFQEDVATAKEIIKCAHAAGLYVCEFTNRGKAAYTVFQELVKYAENEFPEMILGIGSIVDAPTAAIYLQAGADFIVSPMLQKDIALLCNRRKVLWSAGCGTLTEISQAEELGAEVVKLFPGESVGGPAFVKAIKAPCPWTSVMPTGGVSLDNLEEWLQSGVHCVGMGSQLISKTALKNKDFEGITSDMKKASEIVKKFKSA